MNIRCPRTTRFPPLLNGNDHHRRWPVVIGGSCRPQPQRRHFKELGSIPPPPRAGPSATSAGLARGVYQPQTQRTYVPPPANSYTPVVTSTTTAALAAASSRAASYAGSSSSSGAGGGVLPRTPSMMDEPSAPGGLGLQPFYNEPPRQFAGMHMTRPSPGMDPSPRRYDHAAAQQGTFHIQDMVPVVPTFFVPVPELFEMMPGYTVEHINTYFKETHQFESITYGGVHMLRMHGWLGNNDMIDSVTANERFRQYEPRVDLADEWGKVLMGAHGQWIPIDQLIERAPAQLREQCFLGGKTWKKNHSDSGKNDSGGVVKNGGLTEDLALFYFAQMQHKFGFDPRCEPCGAVMWIPAGNRPGLEHHQSPCPLVFNELARCTKYDCIDAQMVHQRLDREAKLQLKHSFKSWKDFVDHHPYFSIDEAGLIHCRRLKERMDLKNAPLEVQIARAAQSSDKRAVRALRRRHAKESNPNNPLLNKGFLLDTIQSYLPPDRPMKMKDLVNSLPQDVVDLLPTMHTKFFSKARTHMEFFEMFRANNFFLQRAGLPLPPGTLRQHFTEYEMVRLCAEWLQRFPQRNVCKTIMLRLPYGARRQSQKSSGGLVGILEKYPESFSIIKVANEEYGMGARIKLVGMPDKPPGYEDDGLFDQQVFAADHEVMDHNERGGGGGGGPPPGYR